MRWTLLAALVGLVSFVGGMLVAPIDLTIPARLPTALLLDAQERYYASIRAPEIREDVKPEDIPEVLRNAVIAAEDERYFSHRGVDPVAIGRAAYHDVFDEGRKQGGSTITQQWVKNIYVGREKTYLRKMREAVVAYRAEKKFGKAEILHRYLNSVYLGNGTYGVQAASKYYFGVPVKDLALDRASGRRSPVLELARAAMLAGIINAPSANNPVKSMPNAKARQLYALERMRVNSFISPIDMSRAYRQALPLAKEKPAAEATEAPIFTDMVTAELKETLTDDELYGGGLRVKTTLDLIMQRAVEQAVFQTLPGLNPSSPDPEEPDAAVVAIDPRTGDLKAIYSSRYTRNGFNAAVHGRVQTGSAIKPFTLAAALQSGRTLDTVYPGPSCLVVTRKPYYRPCNAERSGGRSYTLRRALANSVNTVYAKLAVDVGTQKVKDVAVAAGMGPASGIGTNPAMSLGAVGVSPLSVAQAYATLAAGGVRRDVRLVLEERRNADTAKTFSGIEVMKADPSPAGTQAIPKAVAEQVVDAMYDVVERGTARNARVPGKRVFGKTGSTNDVTNAWFAGCVPELCVVTWMGHKNGVKPLGRVHGVRPVYGGTLPALVFSRFWKHHEALVAAEAAKEAGIGSPSPSVSPTRRRPRTPTPSRVAPPTASPTAGPTTPAPSPTGTTAAPTPTIPPPPTSEPAPSGSASATVPAPDGTGGPAPP